MTRPPVSESLRSIADRIKAITSDIVGSNHASLMDEHANLMALVALLERPPAPVRMPGGSVIPGRPEPRHRRPR